MSVSTSHCHLVPSKVEKGENALLAFSRFQNAFPHQPRKSLAYRTKRLASNKLSSTKYLISFHAPLAY